MHVVIVLDFQNLCLIKKRSQHGFTISIQMYKTKQMQTCACFLLFSVLSPGSSYLFTCMTIFSAFILLFIYTRSLSLFQYWKTHCNKVALLLWHSLIDNKVCQRPSGIQWWLRSDSVFEAVLFVSGNLFYLGKWPFRIQHEHVITAGAKHQLEASEVR